MSELSTIVATEAALLPSAMQAALAPYLPGLATYGNAEAQAAIALALNAGVDAAAQQILAGDTEAQLVAANETAASTVDSNTTQNAAQVAAQKQFGNTCLMVFLGILSKVLP